MSGTELDELRSVVRAALTAAVPESQVRAYMESGANFDRALWNRMANKMLLHGLAIPEALGGSGFTPVELGIVFEEMGRRLVPSPFFASIGLAATALLTAGTEQAKRDLLPSIADGSVIATLGFSEDGGGWDERAVSASAALAPGGDWMIDGVKRYVPEAELASLLLIVARTPDGLGLFAVEPQAAGVGIEVELTMDQTRKLARITLSGTPAVLVSEPGDAWPALRRSLRLSAAYLAAEQCGGARQSLENAVAYAKDRIQFGEPIGALQTIKHKCADMMVDVEMARSALDDCLRAAADDDPSFEMLASVAKVFCSDAYFRCAAQTVQIHGGIGFTWEHSAHLYLKRAKTSQAYLGTPTQHRALVSTAIGL